MRLWVQAVTHEGATNDKVGVHHAGVPRQGLGRIVEEARRSGYDGTEIRGLQGEMCVPRMAPFTRENLDRTMADLNSGGSALCCMDTPVRFHDPAKSGAAMGWAEATIAPRSVRVPR